MNNEPVVQKWVSVKDKLPDTPGTYLVYADAFGIVLAHWYGDKFGCGNAFQHVTYWMPLPELPKEDNL